MDVVALGDSVKAGLWTGQWTGLWTGNSRLAFSKPGLGLGACSVGARNKSTAAAGRSPRQLSA